MTIEPLAETLHHGGIAGLSVCHWKPVFMTCGQLDRTVKLWNYEKQTLLWTRRYADDVLDVSLHPTGLYALVATANSVAFHVLFDDGPRPQPWRLLPVASCQLTRFSSSGHMFALVHGANVDVYCSVTFRKRFELDGHKNTVSNRSVCGFSPVS